jgi:hypothetical protein
LKKQPTKVCGKLARERAKAPSRGPIKVASLAFGRTICVFKERCASKTVASIKVPSSTIRWMASVVYSNPLESSLKGSLRRDAVLALEN